MQDSLVSFVGMEVLAIETSLHGSSTESKTHLCIACYFPDLHCAHHQCGLNSN